MSLFNTDRVLIPIDFSDEALETQAETLKMVQDPEHLHILHVLPRLNPAEPGMAWGTIDDEKRKANTLAALKEKFPRDQYDGVHFHVAIGDPSAEIVDFAGKESVDLIVISSHGYTGLKRFLLGSVAERVVRFAPCPVLVLRRKD
ncbi:MAG: universal stress protein [Spirulinaceae cyanobacterium RM2_2_10]|nr:universal stress protein [Spirulinaceae cyanobacterium SM2_1_0]NJO19271.1 universal stress protein [Spirulinaceae cyanobacterium RM2_2_10]